MPRKRTTQAQDSQDPYAGLSDEGHNEFAADLLQDAATLHQEKVDVMERIDKNRQALRLVKATGHLSEKQAKAVDLTYPVRTKKGEDAGESTTTTTDAPAAA